MPRKSMTDASVPNAGRIYDYLLGGHHNFEVDRMAGDQVAALIPFISKAMRLSRWCLQDVARTLTTERGFDTIVDFASGLPTMDHFHTAAAPGTTVIYSDSDPVTVEYGREILGDTPNAHYFEADCRRPEELLSRPEVREILGDNRHVAFVYWGVTMYLTDEEITHVARSLYDWSDEASCWVVYLMTGKADHPNSQRVLEIYRQMGEHLFAHPVEVFEELVEPWHADELGYRTVAEWHGIELTMTEEDLQSFDPGGSGYGIYLVK
ncbi:MAG TPA: SAM-dependent methyltransferase [Anaerolineae bacterium]|nr:SAM-dependent methyltransferase [Anaerolineae bacterium]